MTSLSVEAYMKRLDLLASKSIPAPELFSPSSSSKRQPLGNLSVNHARSSAENEAIKDTAVLKPQALPQHHRTITSRHHEAASDGRTDDDSERLCTDEDDHPPAFRQRSSSWTADPDLDDMWTLKRASPIRDENDEEDDEIYSSPTKKSRTHTLSWTDSLDTDSNRCLQDFCRRS